MAQVPLGPRIVSLDVIPVIGRSHSCKNPVLSLFQFKCIIKIKKGKTPHISSQQPYTHWVLVYGLLSCWGHISQMFWLLDQSLFQGNGTCSHQV